MTKKIASFLDISAEFGEAFLRRSGRGILDGFQVAFRLIGEFSLTALAVYFSVQMLEAQKVCETKTDTNAAEQSGKPFIEPVPVISNAGGN